jgi:hypothetical protein
VATTKRISPIRKDITGKRFGRWTVLHIYEPNHRRWVCRCECGNTKSILRSTLVCGESKSCGCSRSEWCRDANITHGHTARTLIGAPNTATYTVWRNMLARCSKPTNSGYHRYGGRGISVCQSWEDFESFLSDMGHKPKGKSLDRINNDGDYSPENCRWATVAEQSRNQSRNRPVTWMGETMILPDWETKLGIPRKALIARRDKGWSVERMFTQPFRRSPTKKT